MAIVSSRKSIHLKDIDRLNQRKTQILDQVSFEISYADNLSVATNVGAVGIPLACHK